MSSPYCPYPTRNIRFFHALLLFNYVICNFVFSENQKCYYQHQLAERKIAISFPENNHYTWGSLSVLPKTTTSCPQGIFRSMTCAYYHITNQALQSYVCEWNRFHSPQSSSVPAAQKSPTPTHVQFFCNMYKSCGNRSLFHFLVHANYVSVILRRCPFQGFFAS